MSDIKKLISKYCSNGVEYRTLDGDNGVARIKGGRDYKSFDSGNIPIYGSGGIMGYCNTAVYDKPTVLIPRKGSISNIFFVNTPFWNVDTIFYTEIDTNIINPKFLYYWICNYHVEKLNTSNAARPALTREVLKDVPIPVPPLPVQEEIVHILDSFTALETALETELELRKKQYEYYGRTLFEKYPESYWIPIGDLGKWQGGKTPSMDNQDYWENGDVPWISSKDMKYSVLNNTEDHITQKAVTEAGAKLLPAGITAVVTRSGILKRFFPVAYVPFETTINQDIKALTVKDGIMNKYAAYVIQVFSEEIRIKTKKIGGTVDSLDFDKVLAFKVPVPDFDEQKRIVDILEKFITLTTDTAEGLPAEITMRHQQYEYYRDKLLTFDRLDGDAV